MTLHPRMEAKAKQAARHLADALNKEGFPAAMCLAAARGFYGDFTSTLAAPKMELVRDIRELKQIPAEVRERLAARVMRGEFDG